MLAAKNNFSVSMAVSFTILTFWLISLIFCLKLNISDLSSISIFAGIYVRTFLHAGIFIIIHDSIHGVVSQSRKINSLMGWVAAGLYALLSYKTLAINHRQHHRYPATEKDPDFCVANSHNYWLWYVSFMKNYQQGKQCWILFLGMTIIFFSLIAFQVAIANILLFWVIPIILSSLQLFTFGIYLPHRPTEENYRDRHQARSNNYSVFMSFITCYHFGYHWEHHQYPHLPWYELPSVRQKS